MYKILILRYCVLANSLEFTFGAMYSWYARGSSHLNLFSFILMECKLQLVLFQGQIYPDRVAHPNSYSPMETIS
jgi:hypothetical protein